MSNTIKNRSYSVRVTFDASGVPVIGNVTGFYAVDSDCFDIRPVADGIILQIAKALHITKSSKTPLVNRKSAKKPIIPSQQMELISVENQKDMA